VPARTAGLPLPAAQAVRPVGVVQPPRQRPYRGAGPRRHPAPWATTDDTIRSKLERAEAELDTLLTHFAHIANPIAVGWLALRVQGWRTEVCPPDPEIGLSAAPPVRRRGHRGSSSANLNDKIEAVRFTCRVEQQPPTDGRQAGVGDAVARFTGSPCAL